MQESIRDEEHNALNKAVEAYLAKGGKIKHLKAKERKQTTLGGRVVFHDIVLGLRQCDQVMSNHDLMDIQ